MICEIKRLISFSLAPYKKLVYRKFDLQKFKLANSSAVGVLLKKNIIYS